MLKFLHHYKKLCIGVIVLILIGSTSFYLYFEDTYIQYDRYETNNKQLGILQHYTQKLEGRYYISLYYPSFKDQKLSQIIEAYKQSHLQVQPTHKM